MPRLYSLAYLTAAPLSPPDVVTLGARLGYGAVGVRALPAAPGGAFDPLIEDRALLRETVARIKDTGVGVFDVEIVRLAPDFAVEQFRPFLDVCGALGARAVLVAGDDPDEARLTASYAAFCDAAAPYGLSADLEFMPWTAVANARTALRIVAGAAKSNGGVLVDSLHAGRSATTPADIAAIPRAYLHYAQICDAPTPTPATNEELIFTARCARLPPGEGGIDLAGIFAALPAGLPVSVEVPHEVRKPAVGVEAWARDMLADARRILGA